jgi:P27 family predicted phage terminase small subunit
MSNRKGIGGKPRLPKSVKENRGTLRHHREDGFGVEAPRLEEKKYISELTGNDRKWFDLLYENIEPLGILSAIDLFNIEIMAKARARMEECEIALKNQGVVLIIESEKGSYTKKNDYQLVYMDYFKIFQSISSRYGLSPSDRASMATNKDGEKEESELSKLIKAQNDK